MPAICKLSFFRISMSQQTSATTCKAHDFYYSIKIRQMTRISVDINGLLRLELKAQIVKFSQISRAFNF